MKLKFSLLISLFLFLFSSKFIWGASCSNIAIQSQFPSPIPQSYNGLVTYTLSGSDLNSSSQYRLKIHCSLVSNPSSEVGSVIGGTMTLTINADNICLQDTYKNGAKTISLVTPSGAEICQLGSYQTIVTPQCTLKINPNIVAPGNQITLSVDETITEGFKIAFYKNGSVIDRIPRDRGAPFSINYTAPGEPNNYTVKLLSSDDTIIYCSNSFSVQLNPPTVAPTNTPAPTSTPLPTLAPGAPTPTPTPPNLLPGTGAPIPCSGFVLNIGTYQVCSPVGFLKFGDVLSKLLPYVFVIAGLILFFLIVSNGFKLLTSAGNPKTMESAKEGLTAALVGFLIVIASYWLIQMAEFIFHLNILGNP